MVARGTQSTTASGSQPGEGIRLLVRTAVLGFALGLIGVLALTVAGWPRSEATNLTFSLAALVFGFGIMVWASTLLFGRTMSMAAETLDTSSDWTPEGSRQAMAVLAVVGGGAMVGTILGTWVLGALGF